ncbi:cysteine hydrolase family protein [Paenibacillus sp. XY044]|uniref:cysteine hydrolase family protein n=1 Tax=Paenibacillus sp. XY044 TaxID=2026089 RepID=UPI000B9915F5|nr:cysteine hydrolase family protein [Paenibacillus sp. XY044]OZB98341.1 cysteine hydrolase [Paenibacillus sp. XY044]
MSGSTALLVIDVQEGMFVPEYPVFDGEALLDKIQGLITGARSSGVPVVYIQHNEEPGEQLEPNSFAWQIQSRIAPAEGEIIVQKITPDGFHETDLQEKLESLGVQRLIVSGIQTDMCVEATSKRAGQLGYDVVVVEDAHTTYDQGSKTAREIIEEYNGMFRDFAKVQPAASIEF